MIHVLDSTRSVAAEEYGESVCPRGFRLVVTLRSDYTL